MQELMTKKDAIEYLLCMKHDVQAKSPMDIALDTAIEALKQPTIEPEVRHGRWIEATKHRYENGTILTDYECSECCAMVKDSGAEEIESERFCYNCGAKMRVTDTNVGGKGGDDNG